MNKHFEQRRTSSQRGRPTLAAVFLFAFCAAITVQVALDHGWALLSIVVPAMAIFYLIGYLVGNQSLEFRR